MPTPPATERLRFTPRSVVRAVAIFGATVALLALFAASRRVLGWIVVAVIVAGLLHPIVAGLSRRMPRGLAVLAVVVGVLAGIGGVTWALVDDIVDEVDRLERAAPRAAREIQNSERWGDLATEIDLVERVDQFVREVPRRLQGGDTPDALRSAATRGVAFLATGVLTLFLLLQGPRLVEAGLRQVPVRRRDRAGQVAAAAYRRSCRYARRTFVKVLAAGALAFLCARFSGVPGPAALAVWMGLWAMVPLVGAVIGALPVLLLSGVFETRNETTLLVLTFAAWLALEALVVQRWVERDSLHAGPFLTAAVGLVSLEMYGLGGALVALVILFLGLAVADELTPEGTTVAES
jgi:predicted PurR-regulated permease PerM